AFTFLTRVRVAPGALRTEGYWISPLGALRALMAYSRYLVAARYILRLAQHPIPRHSRCPATHAFGAEGYAPSLLIWMVASCNSEGMRPFLSRMRGLG